MLRLEGATLSFYWRVFVYIHLLTANAILAMDRRVIFFECAFLGRQSERSMTK